VLCLFNFDTMESTSLVRVRSPCRAFPASTLQYKSAPSLTLVPSSPFPAPVDPILSSWLTGGVRPSSSRAPQSVRSRCSAVPRLRTSDRQVVQQVIEQEADHLFRIDAYCRRLEASPIISKEMSASLFYDLLNHLPIGSSLI
jgi:hypothetical protein